MHKKILLLLSICIISLVGCSKKEWNQEQESLGNIKIESTEETNINEETSTEIITETLENTEQETTPETSSMKILYLQVL